MTTLSTHPLDDPDLLSLIADPWTPTKVEFARLFVPPRGRGHHHHRKD